MEPTPSARPGFFASLRSLGDGFLASIEGRIRLFATELQEEKFRVIRIFIWISAIVFTGMMAAIFASLVLVYLFWESARLFVLCGLAAFYATALLAIIVAFRRYLARQPSPFAATLQELGADRACIRKEN